MAEKTPQSGGPARTFAQLVSEAPSAAEAMGTTNVTLTRAVMRSDKEGMFLLATAGGQTLELPVDAVESHTVLQETQGQRIVQIQVPSDRVPAGQTLKPPALEGFHHTIKEVITDPIADWKLAWADWPGTHPVLDNVPTSPVADSPYTLAENAGQGTLAENIGVTDPGSLVTNPAVAAAAAVPFVMATPHHAPQAAIAMQSLAAGQAGAALRTLPIIDQHTLKEVIKDPITDVPFTRPILDYPYTVIENIGIDPSNTLAEGVGVDLPGGGVVNPALGAAVRAAPFALSAGGGIAPSAQAGQWTFPGIDQLQTMAYFDVHTLKEAIKDPIYDVPGTRPALDNPTTWIESIGVDPTNTLVEGVGIGNPGGGVINPGVWGLPGLMF